MKISIPVRENSFAVRFPNKCVFSGQARETGLRTSFEKKEILEGKPIKNRLAIILPTTTLHTKQAKTADKIFLYTLVILGVIAFIGGMSSDESFFWGLVLGLGALALEIILVLILYKYVGNIFAKVLNRPPIEPPLGVVIKYSEKDDAAIFEFKNEGIAREFKELNQIIFADDPQKDPIRYNCPICETNLDAISLPILQACHEAGPKSDLQVVCINCGMHIPKYDLMKLISEEEPNVFKPVGEGYEDQFYYRIKFSTEGICWYCESEPAKPGLGIKVPMYRKTEEKLEDGKVASIDWDTEIITVPRCEKCANDKKYTSTTDAKFRFAHIHHFPKIKLMKSRGWMTGEKPKTQI